MRRFVAEIAIEAIADAFGAEAVMLVRQSDSDSRPEVSSRFPPSWDESSGSRFELVGQLWRIFDAASAPTDSPVRCSGERFGKEMLRIGAQHVWLGSHRSEGLAVATAVVLSRPLGEAEQSALARVLRSVVGAMRPPAPRAGRGRTLTVISPPGGNPARRPAGEVEVQVTSDDGQTVHSTRGKGATEDLAVARAALALASATQGPRLDSSDALMEVMFAGRTSIDRLTVSIVVLNDEKSAPRLGLAVSNGDGRSGPGEAVLSALNA